MLTTTQCASFKNSYVSKMCLRPHQLPFVTGSASRDQRNAPTSRLSADSFLGEKTRLLAVCVCAQACRLPGKHLSEVTFLKWWKLLSQSLGARALEKSEELTTSVADLLFKLIRFFHGIVESHRKGNHKADHLLVKPQGDRLSRFLHK